MALKDLFDRDPQSKEELRNQIKKLQLDLNAKSKEIETLQVENKNLSQKNTAIKNSDSQLNLLTPVGLGNSLATPDDHASENSVGNQKSLELIEKLQRSKANLSFQLNEEKEKHKIAKEKNKIEYEKLKNAIEILKKRIENKDDFLTNNYKKATTTNTIFYNTNKTAIEHTDLNILKKSLDAREAQLAISEKNFDHLLNKFGIRSRSVITDLNSKIDQLRQNLAAEKSKNDFSSIAELQKKLKEAQSEIFFLKNGTSQDQLKNELASKEIYIQSLLAKVSRLNEDLEAAHLRLNEVNLKIIPSDRLTIMSRQIDQKNSEINRLTREKKRIESEHQKFLRKISTLESRLESENRKTLTSIANLELALEKSESNEEKLKKLINSKNNSSAVRLVSEYTHVGKFQKISFTNPKILNWLIEDADAASVEIDEGNVGIHGEGPWHSEILISTLNEKDFHLWEIPDADLEYVVVGRKNWSKNALLEQITEREGFPLKIYSQEMFIAMLITGKDPFDSNDDELLEAFCEDHPALSFLRSLKDSWPNVTSFDDDDVIEIDVDDFGVSESPLHLLGYRVGVTSDLSKSDRRKILVECLESKNLDFSDDSSHDYIRSWGRSASAKRLYRMAFHIKSLIDGRNGRDPRKPQARSDWIEDLNWLNSQYYSTYRSKFSWPNFS
jgi:hypothetical protein